jgi:hypothetical protein
MWIWQPSAAFLDVSSLNLAVTSVAAFFMGNKSVNDDKQGWRGQRTSNPLHLIQADVVWPAVVELRRPGDGVVRQVGRFFQRATGSSER